MNYLVVVSSHALDRAFERWPTEATGISTIRGEVLEALRSGRVSTRKPPAFRSGTSGRVLYTWTADGRRAHVLRATAESFRVVTVLDQAEKATA